MEQAVQVKQQPVWWGILKKMINFIYKKILSHETEPTCIHHTQPTW